MSARFPPMSRPVLIDRTRRTNTPILLNPFPIAYFRRWNGASHERGKRKDVARRWPCQWRVCGSGIENRPSAIFFVILGFDPEDP